MNIPISILKTEFVIKNLIKKKKKKPDPDGFIGKFDQTFKKEIMPILCKFF